MFFLVANFVDEQKVNGVLYVRRQSFPIRFGKHRPQVIAKVFGG